MIKDNRIKMIVSFLITLLPMLVGVCLWGKIGAMEGTALRSVKIMSVFVMPSIMIVLDALCILFSKYEYKKNEQHKKIISLTLFIIPLISVYVSLIFYSILLGWDINIQLVTAILAGVLFMVMGNYMPKSKRNRTFGLKIRWTLANEDNWNASHRFAGKIWVAIGFVTLFTGFLPIVPFFIAFFGLIVVATVIPVVYSYRYYKNNVESGKQTEADYDFHYGMSSKKAVVLTLILIAVILIGCSFLLFTGSVSYSLTDDALEISATYHADETICYEDIVGVEYRENAEKGTRVMGFGSPRLLLGTFKNDEFGAFTRFSYTKCRSDIIITVGDDKIAISCETEEETFALYEALLEKLGK